MAENEVTVIDPKKSDNEGSEKKSNKSKYLFFAIVIIIAVFVYDISPADLIPLVPIDDIAVTGGGLLGVIAMIYKYLKGGKKE